jgi:hypothetical protein
LASDCPKRCAGARYCILIRQLSITAHARQVNADSDAFGDICDAPDDLGIDDPIIDDDDPPIVDDDGPSAGDDQPSGDDQAAADQ